MIWLGRTGIFLALAAIVVLTVTGAYYEVFSKLEVYDDEGLMMLSIRQVLDGHRLYDEVRVGYGPIYYLIKEIIHGPLGVPLTHDAVRLTATLFRLLAATLAAGGLFLMTRHISLAGIGFLLVAIHLRFVRSEPGHPQEIAALVLMTTALVAVAMNARRAILVCASLGFLVASLMMIKSNLGVFTAVAVGLAVLASMPANRVNLTLWGVSVATAVALPIVLIRSSLGEPWAAQLAGCAAAWVVATAMLSSPRRDGDLRLVHPVVLVTAVAGGAALLLLPSILSGTSLTTLIECLVIGPHSLVTMFVTPFVMPHMVPAALTGMLVASLVALMVGTRPSGSGAAHAIGLAKLVFAAVIIRTVWQLQPAALIGLLTPFAWLVVLPGGDEAWTPHHRFARLLLAWLAVIEPLQVYPVPGSQPVLGSLAHVLCGVVCLGDAANWARTLLPVSVHRPARSLAAAATLGVTLLLAVSWRNAVAGVYRTGVPLALPGAARLHLGARQVDILRRLVDTIAARCDVIFAYPGFNSLYFWTGQASPTLDLISHEIRLVTPERQDAIVAALAQSRSPCFVRGPGLTLLAPDPHFEERMASLFGAGRQPRANLIQIGYYQVLTRIPGSSARPTGATP